MYEIKQSTAETVPFFVHDSAGDALEGLSDGDFTKTLSKGSGSFGSMTVTITEMADGWYSIPLSTGHSDTLGLLTVVFTHITAKQVNLQWRVEARLVDDLNNAITAPTAVQNRTEMDSNSTQLTAIVADTNELQTDWANSGRLDLVLDSRMAESSIDTTGGVVDSVTQVGTVVGGATSAAQTTAQNDLDIITGASGVNLLTATQASIDAIEADTNELQGDDVPGLIAALNDLSAAQVNTECDTALTDYDGPTNTEFEVRTPTAAQLAYITDHAETALPVTFSGGTTTTAIFTNVDGSGASSTDDVYNGRILIFNIGTLNQQVTDITDYDGGTTTATITAVTTAVTGSHTAILV